MKTPAIWYIDTSLRDISGHYFTYTYSLYKYAVENNLQFTVFGHKNVSSQLTALMPVEPVFRYGFHDRFYSRFMSNFPRSSYTLDFLRGNYEFYNDLKTALKGRASRESILFMSMVDHRQLLAWAWWLRSKPVNDSPVVVLMFRLNYFDVENLQAMSGSRSLAKICFNYLENYTRGHRVRIATDSRRLAFEYLRLTKIPIEVFPIPHTEGIARAAAFENKGSTDGLIKFVTLGGAREEKGFPLLVRAIQILHQQFSMKNMQFILQSNITSYHHHAMIKYRTILENMNLPNVKLIKQPLDMDAYLQLLKDADVVVLPYSRRTYYSRTAGPMLEALAAAKPVIVTDDTWMSEQLSCYGSGLTFKDGDAENLALTLMRASSRYAELTARAFSNRQAWIDFHNPRVFFQMLLDQPTTNLSK